GRDQLLAEVGGGEVLAGGRFELCGKLVGVDVDRLDNFGTSVTGVGEDRTFGGHGRDVEHRHVRTQVRRIELGLLTANLKVRIGDDNDIGERVVKIVIGHAADTE